MTVDQTEGVCCRGKEQNEREHRVLANPFCNFIYGNVKTFHKQIIPVRDDPPRPVLSVTLLQWRNIGSGDCHPWVSHGLVTVCHPWNIHGLVSATHESVMEAVLQQQLTDPTTSLPTLMSPSFSLPTTQAKPDSSRSIFPFFSNKISTPLDPLFWTFLIRLQPPPSHFLSAAAGAACSLPPGGPSPAWLQVLRPLHSGAQ